jgi:nickel/cobalt exporter
MRSVTFVASAGAPALAAWSAPDAFPVDSNVDSVESAIRATPADGALRTIGVPGGVREELGSLVGTVDPSPLVMITSLLLALALGAAHALSPGHGKTVMAAYLIGSRGTLPHAIALGLTVTLAHTLGVLALAALVTVTVASQIVPPERLYPVLGLVSSGVVIAIGGWLLMIRYREWREHRAHDSNSDREVHHHEHPLEHGEHGAPLDHSGARLDHSGAPLDHSHGAFRHSHVPQTSASPSWRSLFILGLSGGLVPSASALILLLGSIAAGRPAYGLVLVIAFGVGMAVVLTGVGFAVVRARRLLERLPSDRIVRPLLGALPTAAAIVVVGAGLLLTGQALAQIF